jgi:ubiquinone/menaquinone biosynthesis C-methylase UbiE
MLKAAITPEMHYDDWATSYEKDTKGWGYCAHTKLAEGLKKKIKMIPSCPLTLDVGIGTGLLSQEILDFSPAAKITGVDISSRMLSLCEKAGVARDLKRADISRDRLMFKDSSFDMTVSAGVMENVENIGNALQEMVRVTRQNGLVAFTYLPSHEKPMRHLMPKKFRPGMDENGKRVIGNLTLYGHNERKVNFYCKTLGLEPLMIEEFVGYRTYVMLTVKYKLFIGRKK